MSELSPQAQEVFWAFNRAASGKPYDWHYLPAIAAALRAAADQVAPVSTNRKQLEIRFDLLRIAAELRGTTNTTETTMTDTTRDLIQRMSKELDLYRQMARDDCTSTHPLADEARAYLAQPEPEGPTVMEIIALADEIEAEELGQVDLVRRALARWGK